MILRSNAEGYLFVLSEDEYNDLLSGKTIKKITANAEYEKVIFSLICHKKRR